MEEGASDVRLLTGAYGQVSTYARDLSERPPYILVLDVGRTLLVWDRWAGTYGGFNAARRIDLRALADSPEDVALLRDIWVDPSRRDPGRHAQAVTEEIAGLLAELAATLEERGHDQERIARFLIRCVFTMFAEDVHLLPDAAFRRLLEAVQPSGPGGFVAAAEALWRAMDESALFGHLKLQALVARRPSTAADAARHFDGARKDLVARHLETLAILGEVRATEGGRYAAAGGY